MLPLVQALKFCKLNDAVGFAVTVTICEVVAVQPLVFVTVNVTVYVPELA